MNGITIKDIAKALDVSIATVSRALRNHPDVSKETRQMVMEMAKTMDYHPNLLASGLSSRKSKIIGIVVPTIGRGFWSKAISGIENFANKRGYRVMIFQSGENFEHEVEGLEMLTNSKVDGILLAISKDTNNPKAIQNLLDRKIPLVLFERVLEDVICNKVVTDDFTGAYMASQHLLQSGYRKIAHFTGSKVLNVCKERIRGYRTALWEFGIEPQEDLIVETSFDREVVVTDFIRFYEQKKEKPDAIFCFADVIAIGVFTGAKQLGLKIPDELGLVGFGDDEVSSLISPSLTTLQQPSFLIGEKAAALVLNQIEDDRSTPVTEVLRPILIIRESTSKKRIHTPSK